MLLKGFMRRPIVACLALATTLLGCREPTQITVVVTSDVACAENEGTAITVGEHGDLEDRPPSATTLECAGSSPRIGSLVVVPSGDKDDEVAIKVALGVNGTVDECVSPPYADHCIVARRLLRYLPHTKLELPIAMRRECRGVFCDPNTTCVLGQCVSAEVSPDECTGSGCDETVLLDPDAGPTADAGADASLDAAADASVEASADSGGDAPPDQQAEAATDAGSDAGTDAGQSLAPDLLVPWNGWNTGAPGGSSRALTPTFRWRQFPGATSYEIEIDDSAAFDSPEVQTSVPSGTSFRPPTDLPVSGTTPVGRRYYWRVRACSATCGPWSMVRYVNVGRLGGDIDGDGFADLVAGAPGNTQVASNDGLSYVFLGSASGIVGLHSVLHATSQMDASFGLVLSIVGDVNADGHSELFVAAPFDSGTAAVNGIAFLYDGTATGPALTPQSLTTTVPFTGALYGSAVAGRGDVNADGFVDVAVGAGGYTNEAGAEGAVYLYLGSASGLVTLPAQVQILEPTDQFDANFGTALSMGDLDSDGFWDLVVGASGFDDANADNGRVYVYMGSPSGLSTPPIVLPNPEPQFESFFGFSVEATGDLDGDGYADLAVGAYKHDTSTVDRGAVFLYRGGPSGISATPTFKLSPTGTTMTDTDFGFAVAGGADFDGDGLHDLLVGAPSWVAGSSSEGTAFLYSGGADLKTLSNLTLSHSAVSDPNARYAAAVGFDDYDGDGFDDLVIGAPNFDQSNSDQGVVFIVDGETILTSTPTLQPNPDGDIDGRFGTAVSGS